MEDITEENIKKWVNSGLLEGLENEEIKKEIANNLQKVANRMIYASSFRFTDETETFIFPIIRKVFIKTSSYDPIKILLDFDEHIRFNFDGFLISKFKTCISLKDNIHQEEAEFCSLYVEEILRTEKTYLLA